MSYFPSLLQKNNTEKYDGKPLWKYLMDDDDFKELQDTLRYCSLATFNPIDATLFYAEWWKRFYNGGSPSKVRVFESLEGNARYIFNPEDFYEMARRGGQMLGFKWLRRQNTLYFKTLLLQGGLPLFHISQNHGKYQDFLLAVLDEQPEKIEDFIFNPNITGLLPYSSQNDIIYENCFEIVRSILNEEDLYDDLLNSSEELIHISNALKVRKRSLSGRQRTSRPKNYWILQKDEGQLSINLRLGLSSNYSPDGLSNILGFEANDREYQFYVNDILICVFRKKLNGDFKTDWYNQKDIQWNGEDTLPQTYVLVNGEKIEINDFIQTIPSLTEPTLWSKFGEGEWRLIKGSGSQEKEAALLFPDTWSGVDDSECITILNNLLHWYEFEGNATLYWGDEIRKYFSEISSFEWTVFSQKPSWMTKSNMPVIKGMPKVAVYNNDENRVPENSYKVFFKKHGKGHPWQELRAFENQSQGCYDLKIVKEELVAYDTFFSIGNFQLSFQNQSLYNACLTLNHSGRLTFEFKDIPELEISSNDFGYDLKLDFRSKLMPSKLGVSLGEIGLKRLFFEMESPFQGVELVDKEGSKIAADEKLSLSNLYGIRILANSHSRTEIRFKNNLKTDVKVFKELKEKSQPLIAYQDELSKLFYLSDSMDYRNEVLMELVEGRSVKEFKIAAFSHTLDVTLQFENKVRLYRSEDYLPLFAIPLNCHHSDISLLPLIYNEGEYLMPNVEFTNQFIIISEMEGGYQLMPRFVNTDESFIGISKEDRFEGFIERMNLPGFNNDIWNETLRYLKICVDNKLPFTTLDQLRVLAGNSNIAAKAFMYFLAHQEDDISFIENTIPLMERDLGFCFHWISRDDWHSALLEVNNYFGGDYFKQFLEIIGAYFQSVGLSEIFQFISGNRISPNGFHQKEIQELRGLLGERVLNELPVSSPRITHDYGISIHNHRKVLLLIQSPVAVAESIMGGPNDYPIWGMDEVRTMIRRNIQYSLYLSPDFYKRVIHYVLSKN